MTVSMDIFYRTRVQNFSAPSVRTHLVIVTQFREINHFRLIYFPTETYEILIYFASQVDSSLGLKRIKEKRAAFDKSSFTNVVYSLLPFISIPCVLRSFGSMVVPWSSDDQTKNAVKFISVINIDD